MLHENKHVNFFLKLGYTLLIVFLIAFTARYGLRLGWPFLLAFIFSALIRRPIEYITSKTRLPRGPLAALFTLLILVIFGVCVYLFSSFVYYRAVELINALPTLTDTLMADLSVFEAAVDNTLRELLPMLKDMPFISLEKMMSSALPSINVMGVFSTTASVAGSIPGFLFTVVFIFMATYFFTVQHHDIKDFLKRNLPEKAFRAIGDLKKFLYNSVFKWLKAQALLMSITFCELLAAMMLMKQPNPVVISAGIAVIDALPILGVGTVLLPWALFCVLTGGFKKAMWLVLTYIIVLCVRNALEPRIVGQKIGLNPLVTLLGMFIGFRLGGFFGLVFIPVAVLSILQLQELGYFKLWN